MPTLRDASGPLPCAYSIETKGEMKSRLKGIGYISIRCNVEKEEEEEKNSKA